MGMELLTKFGLLRSEIMPEYKTVPLDVTRGLDQLNEKTLEIRALNADGWLPDKFYGENGINTIDNVLFRHFIRYSEAEKQEILNNRKNAEVLLEPNPNSTEESYKVTVVFEGKTLIFENCKPKKE
jgi:hypothetical protein